ncbi:MAG: hypothetical protein SAL70_07440 [Scytonema sp. PMC 1070.18]|nr:hypothetical protein [Scytonema sp. PMC 1070.18]
MTNHRRFSVTNSAGVSYLEGLLQGDCRGSTKPGFAGVIGFLILAYPSSIGIGYTFSAIIP